MSGNAVKKRRRAQQRAEANSPRVPPTSVSTWTSPFVWFIAGVFLLTLLAYSPAWSGAILWDDDGHITRADLRAWHGLWRIWFEIGATQQYYPVVHSAFWVMHRLWGDNTLGYHLVNISLHATAAVLFAAILRRLAVPGAYLAALIFAVHPVEVESVAWISELKNTLSAVFYLGAAWAYLRFDGQRTWSRYLVALGLFVLAVFSKTVTATLPAALLVVWWWQRGRVRWRLDVVPLLPFFALGLGGGLVTAWVERTQIGAQGAAFEFTFLERALLAGRIIWFYLGHLLWPARLIFIYPRWPVHAPDPVAWLSLAGVVLALVSAWWWRGVSRAPLAVLLLFIGTLAPALGFINVYPFLYSFVADHFQYLAGLSVIAAVAATITTLASRWRVSSRAVAIAAVVALLAPATVLTWRQSQQYANAEALYRTTLAENPSSWMAHNNLGVLLYQRSRMRADAAQIAEAVQEYREALRLNPDFAQAHNNLGSALLDLGQLDEAAAEYQTAQRLEPNVGQIRGNLSLVAEKRGDLLQASGRLADAAAAYREALGLNPENISLHGPLADVLAGMQIFDEAIRHYRTFLNARPHDSAAWTGLGVALINSGHPEEAVTAFRSAVSASDADTHCRQNLARALLEVGRLTEAEAEAQTAIRLAPADPGAHEVLGRVFAPQGRIADARLEFQRALRLDPSYVPAQDGLRSLAERAKPAEP